MENVAGFELMGSGLEDVLPALELVWGIGPQCRRASRPQRDGTTEQRPG